LIIKSVKVFSKVLTEDRFISKQEKRRFQQTENFTNSEKEAPTISYKVKKRSKKELEK
jgi:hypothetical protein